MIAGGNRRILLCLCGGMAAIALLTSCGVRSSQPTPTVDEVTSLKHISSVLGVPTSWENVIDNLRCTFFAIGRSRYDIERAMSHFDFIFLRNQNGAPDAEYVINDVALSKHLGGELRVRYDDFQLVTSVMVLSVPPGWQEGYRYESVVCPAN